MQGRYLASHNKNEGCEMAKAVSQEPRSPRPDLQGIIMLETVEDKVRKWYSEKAYRRVPKPGPFRGGSSTIFSGNSATASSDRRLLGYVIRIKSLNLSRASLKSFKKTRCKYSNLPDISQITVFIYILHFMQIESRRPTNIFSFTLHRYRSAGRFFLLT